MSLLSWFSRKSPSTGGASVAADPTVARVAAAPGPLLKADAGRLDPAAVLKVERIERREWVYSVVREAMLHAGVLSASYKFKVLALDERGRRFLIMVDLARELGGDTVQLLKIEDHIAHTAKTRYDLDINAVYWRTNEQLVAARARAQASASSAAPGAVVAPAGAPRPGAASAARPTGKPLSGVPLARPSGRFEPIQADEVAAFKRALSVAANPPAPVPVGEVVRSGRRSAVAPGYEDTEMIEPSERPDALSNTQYGDLK